MDSKSPNLEILDFLHCQRQGSTDRLSSPGPVRDFENFFGPYPILNFSFLRSGPVLVHESLVKGVVDYQIGNIQLLLENVLKRIEGFFESHLCSTV